MAGFVMARGEEFYAFCVGELYDFGASRQTILATYWQFVLYNSMGVRTADDIRFLEPWMVMKGVLTGDIDAWLQNALQNAFGGPETTLARLVHLDTYGSMNTPIFLGRFFHCLKQPDLESAAAAAIEGPSFEERGFEDLHRAAADRAYYEKYEDKETTSDQSLSRATQAKAARQRTPKLEQELPQRLP